MSTFLNTLRRKPLAATLLFAVATLAAAQTTSVAPVAATATPPKTAGEALFATVNGQAITQKDFHAAFASYLRQAYYHGQVPEGKLTEAREEVTTRMVNRVLLLAEAKRRKIAVDEAKIEETIKEYETRYASSAMWQQNRTTLLPELKQQLAELQLLGEIEKIGKTIAEPTDAEVMAFYKERPQLFTEPEKLRLHTILLKVDPSANKATWDAAREEGKRIVARIQAGAAFEDMARLHSNDGSAEKGGDMGYLHLGMIPDNLQKSISDSPLGAVTQPLDVLEGVAVFRLDERKPSQLMEFKDVSARARDLLKRERVENAWNTFIADLRKSADIKLLDTAQPAKAPDKK